MARFVIACFILANFLLASLAMAANAQAPSPSNSRKTAMAGAHAPGQDSTHQKGEEHVSLIQPGLSEMGYEAYAPELAEGPGQAIRRLRKHHSTDKSIAGGGVILGGFATSFLVSIFCYIRVTRRRHEDKTTPL